MMVKRIATLATCHNRRDKTLKALAGLHAQVLPENVEMIHVIVDDGSNDGTSHEVSERFPDVEIVRGRGDLYWAGGMRFGWEQSVRHKKIDYLFVYNDDVEFFSDALARLLVVNEAEFKEVKCEANVVVGSCASRIDKSTTYGGQVQISRINPLTLVRIDPPDDSYILVDSLNMNCALINKSALRLTNFLASYFVHGGADFEFGLRLRKMGGCVALAPGYYGYCERNPPTVIKSNTLRGYFKERFSGKNTPTRVLFKYYYSHGGIIWIYSFLRLYVTKKSIKLFFFGRWY